MTKSGFNYFLSGKKGVSQEKLQSSVKKDEIASWSGFSCPP
jgi:hypothetical protein